MHSDDHILEQFLSNKHPLPALATHLGMTLIALVQWVDRNADLLAVAKRAMETHIAFLSLRAEAAALIDLTSVSSSTTNEERKRKSSSQLLRHSATRLLTNPTRERGVPCASASPFAPSLSPTQQARPVSDVSSARALVMLAGALDQSASAPSPRQEMYPSEAMAKTSGSSSPLHAPSLPNAESRMPNACLDAPMPPASMPSSITNPPRERSAPCARRSPADLLHQLASSSLPNATRQMPSASPFSDHEIDVLMATLARHFDIDISSDTPDPAPA